MKPLAADEKAVMVMMYTNHMLVRGEVVVKENARVSIWLRTQGVPNYIHLLRPQVVLFGGTPPKSYSYPEIFVATAQVIGFHLAPPTEDPLDYDPAEAHRMMQPLDLILGTFTMKGHIRISTQTDVSTSLDVMRAAWLSIYDANITNPYLPQFNIHVPFLLVSPNAVSFGLS
jgi:hypothetical protein